MGAWIETAFVTKIMRRLSSHPSWVRGLKLTVTELFLPSCKSHPSWVRGLKLTFGGHDCGDLRVAPFMGAWIETLTCVQYDEAI